MTTLTVEIDRDTARNAVGAVSVALGAAAVLAPRTTAGAFGVPADGAVPLVMRMMGVRNAVMGLRTLEATGDEQAKAVQAGFVVGAVDVVAVLAAWRAGLITRRAALAAIVVLGAIAGLGAVAAAD